MKLFFNHQRLFFILFFCIVARPSLALEFMPYPLAKITLEQWESFCTEAKTKLGHSQRTYNDQHIVVLVDTFNAHHYAFTLPGHTAHPSWIVRRIVNIDGEIDIQQVGYYVNDESSFTELFKIYLDLNNNMKSSLQDRNVSKDQ
ncbi:MAG: hypothetical protein ACI9XC_001522 [Gammaproteobacteria bacterium]|jgi:hypothetical protein